MKVYLNRKIPIFIKSFQVKMKEKDKNLLFSLKRQKKEKKKKKVILTH